MRYVNYNHMMPTRYTVNWDTQELVLPGKKADKYKIDDAKLKEPSEKLTAKKGFRKLFQDNYTGFESIADAKTKAGALFFYEKLRF